MHPKNGPQKMDPKIAASINPINDHSLFYFFFILAGTLIGAAVAATALVGYIGGAAPVRFKVMLIAFAWLIVLMMIAELGLGGVIWFKTLRMRSLFLTQWVTEWSDPLKVAFQDMVCGGKRALSLCSPPVSLCYFLRCVCLPYLVVVCMCRLKKPCTSNPHSALSYFIPTL